MSTLRTNTLQTLDSALTIALTDIARLVTLAAAGGAALIGYNAGRTGQVTQNVQVRLGKDIYLTDFGTVTGVDDSALLQRAMDACADELTASLTTSGVLTSSFSGTIPTLHLPKGKLKLNATVNPPAYFNMVGEQTIIEGGNLANDIISAESYQWYMKSITFVGGRRHVNMFNANADSTRLDFENCEFHLSREYSLYTSTIGGVYDHMSANLTVRNSRFLKNKRVLHNVCDSAVIQDTWVLVDKGNLDPSTSAFTNDGGTTGHPILYCNNMFGVPNCGVQGVDRVENVRWIDNKGSVIARGSRFGGESGGIPIVFHQQPVDIVAPWLGRTVSFDGCWLYAGQSVRSDSGVVVLDGHIPQRIVIKDCTGPSDVPYIINPSAFSIPAYIAAWAAATGRDPNVYFRIDIQPNSVGNVDGSIYFARIPSALRQYVTKGKGASIRKVAAQSIPNGFATTPISFDTVISDGFSTFDAGTPTRINLPAGASRMTIKAQVSLAVDGAAKTIAVTLRSSGGTSVAGETMLRGINADSDRFSISADVEGNPGEFWTLNVQHNAAGALNTNDVRVQVLGIDNI
ncbi:hypothetical protein D3C72_608570 [compost metagenome]